MKRNLMIGSFSLLILISALLIGSTIRYKTTIDQQVFEVYSFGGEDGSLRIKGGVAIISPNRHLLNGGEVEYIGKSIKRIEIYDKVIYLESQGKQKTILNNSVTYSGDTKGIIFPDNLSLNKQVGEISSGSLFTENDRRLLKDNLFFSLKYVTIDGQKGEFTVKLNVKKFDLEKNEE